MSKGKLKRSQTEEISQEFVVTQDNSQISNKIFQKMSLKEVVFLAILSAVLMVSCSVMPLVAELTKVLFGIGQLVTALQLSLFVTIALVRVRKPFTIVLVLLFMGAIMVMNSPVMFFSNLFVMFMAEILVLLLFRGYKTDLACFLGGFLVPPLGIMVPAIYNSITAPEVFANTVSNPWVVVAMTLAILVASFIGAFIGLKIGKELTKAGVLKS